MEKDSLWSVQGVWMLLLAATLGDAKLSAVLAHKDTDVMSLMSEVTTSSTHPPTMPQHPNSQTNNNSNSNSNNNMLTGQEFTELSMQSAIVSIDLWCRLGCPSMAVLQCRRSSPVDMI